MEESFLHFIWKYQKYNRNDLRTVQTETVSVIHPGFEHTSAGPDFRMARVIIDRTEWAGAVEIHVRSSDWYRHNHQSDPNYDSVILHVVWTDDRPVRAKGERIPTIELESLVPRITLDRWNELRADMHWIPCEPFLAEIENSFLWSKHWERMAIERLEIKQSTWERPLNMNQNHWEETLFQFIGRAFGLKENADPMEQLARCTPLRIFKRERGNFAVLKALYFGQAGWLEGRNKKKWPNAYSVHYAAFRNKYRLSPMKEHLWKFGGIRPSNFPTVRLEQWLLLYFHTPHLLAQLLELKKLKDWIDFSQNCIGKGFGKAKGYSLAINTIIPFFFYYGRWSGDLRLQEKALNWLHDCPKENNRITRAFGERSVPIRNGMDSQAAIHQFHQYCRPKKCVLCSIGKKVLNRTE